MVLEQRAEGTAEQLQVEPSLEVEGGGRVVGDAAVEHLAEQPQELLRVGERSRTVPVATGDLITPGRRGLALHKTLLEQRTLRRAQPRESVMQVAVTPR